MILNEVAETVGNEDFRQLNFRCIGHLEGGGGVSLGSCADERNDGEVGGCRKKRDVLIGP